MVELCLSGGGRGDRELQESSPKVLHLSGIDWNSTMESVLPFPLILHHWIILQGYQMVCLRDPNGIPPCFAALFEVMQV